jgi:hypothetical protein
MTKPIKIIALICVFLIFALGIWRQLLIPTNLTLRFHPYVGDQALVLNDKQYANPGGKGVFSIRDFQLFVSNIHLSNSHQSFIEQDSYHLARFDGNTPYYQLDITDVDLGKFEQLSFGVGIDPKANGTLLIAGDLDPNSRMAWNWQVGYKFLLLEGSLFLARTKLPLVYHIGFDESYTTLTFPINNQTMSRDGVINLKVDVIALFNQSSAIDMNTTPNVKFDPQDVAKIAESFTNFISVL